MHTIELKKGDTFYAFSDGYVDQFGGTKNRTEKFMTKRFKELLLSNAEKPMAEQKLALDENFINWKGNGLQIDDILVVGIKA